MTFELVWLYRLLGFQSPWAMPWRQPLRLDAVGLFLGASRELRWQAQPVKCTALKTYARQYSFFLVCPHLSRSSLHGEHQDYSTTSLTRSTRWLSPGRLSTNLYYFYIAFECRSSQRPHKTSCDVMWCLRKKAHTHLKGLPGKGVLDERNYMLGRYRNIFNEWI